MSDKHEAKIEVLTAQVRVLQVGSRQVTLSVVRQLDWADPAEVVPFGRVRTNDKLPGREQAAGTSGIGAIKSSDSIEIVGSASGDLVRSVAWRIGLRCTGSGDSMCDEAQALRTVINRHTDRGLPDLSPAYNQAASRLSAHPHDWSRYDPDQETYEEWQALPLIVLAGLR